MIKRAVNEPECREKGEALDFSLQESKDFSETMNS